MTVPVLGFLLAPERLGKSLEALRFWLSRANAVIMAVMMLVLGVAVIGEGIGNF